MTVKYTKYEATGVGVYHTWDANMLQFEIELQGAGAGSGSTTGTAGQSASAGTGAGGGYLKIFGQKSDLGSETSSPLYVGRGGIGGATPGVNVGANGEGTYITLNGGTPWVAGGGPPGSGQACSPFAQNSAAAGGVAGNTYNEATGNAQLILDIIGQHGNYGHSNGSATQGVHGGQGGDSHLGSGGHASPHWGTANAPGNKYGGGAGGGVNAQGGDRSGEPGADGVMIIKEYLS